MHVAIVRSSAAGIFIMNVASGQIASATLLHGLAPVLAELEQAHGILEARNRASGRAFTADRGNAALCSKNL
jgi:hypothetical protein